MNQLIPDELLSIWWCERKERAVLWNAPHIIAESQSNKKVAGARSRLRIARQAFSFSLFFCPFPEQESKKGYRPASQQDAQIFYVRSQSVQKQYHFTAPDRRLHSSGSQFIFPRLM
jgi:hypothetical protein